MLERPLIWLGRLVGKPRGWERVVRRFAPPGGVRIGPRTVRTRDGFQFRADPATLIGWHILFFGQYEPEVSRAIRQCLRPGGVALDVGANIGWQTLLMSRCVGPAGRVVAVEPNPPVRGELESNLALNAVGNVTVLDVALSDSAGSAAFIAPAPSEPNPGNGRLRAAGEVAETQVIEVEKQRLDDVWPTLGLERLDLIKIDVEGWERAVLAGGEATIARYRPRIVFEFDRAFAERCGGDEPTLRRFFERLGYRVTILGSTTRSDHWPDCANLLAAPPA